MTRQDSTRSTRNLAFRSASRAFLLASLVAVSPGLVSCGASASLSTETGNPPVVDRARLSVESRSSDTVAIIGKQGAVPKKARVRVTNQDAGVTEETTADSDGSFTLEITGSEDDTYEIELVESRDSTSVTLKASTLETSDRSNVQNMLDELKTLETDAGASSGDSDAQNMAPPGNGEDAASCDIQGQSIPLDSEEITIAELEGRWLPCAGDNDLFDEPDLGIDIWRDMFFPLSEIDGELEGTLTNFGVRDSINFQEGAPEVSYSFVDDEGFQGDEPQLTMHAMAFRYTAPEGLVLSGIVVQGDSTRSFQAMYIRDSEFVIEDHYTTVEDGAIEEQRSAADKDAKDEPLRSTGVQAFGASCEQDSDCTDGACYHPGTGENPICSQFCNDEQPCSNFAQCVQPDGTTDGNVEGEGYCFFDCSEEQCPSGYGLEETDNPVVCIEGFPRLNGSPVSVCAQSSEP